MANQQSARGASNPLDQVADHAVAFRRLCRIFHSQQPGAGSRIGRRIWIPVIMIAWDITSMLNAWATSAHAFYFTRFWASGAVDTFLDHGRLTIAGWLA
ncbi:MAG TPA: hypothetical protein VFQ52_10550 [Rhizomicrobium sp.]|nr:hypothetical protein [Rhizomicrobium sp.]